MPLEPLFVHPGLPSDFSSEGLLDGREPILARFVVLRRLGNAHAGEAARRSRGRRGCILRGFSGFHLALTETKS